MTTPMNKVTPKSHHVTYSRTGTTATYEIVCDFANRYSYPPRIGDPHGLLPWLKCVEVEEFGEGTPLGGTDKFSYTHARFLCTFSSAQFIEDAPITNIEFGGEVLETGEGSKWKNAGTICEQSQGVYYPCATVTEQLTIPEIPVEAIFALQGKVNYYPFMGRAPQTVLFEGGSSEQVFDYTNSRYYYRLTYRFIVRSMSHNLAWRAPEQAWDDKEHDWATEPNGHGGKKPVYVTGPAGIGGWDSKIPPLYAWADFEPLYGRPGRIVPPPPGDGDVHIYGGLTETDVSV